MQRFTDPREVGVCLIMESRFPSFSVVIVDVRPQSNGVVTPPRVHHAFGKRRFASVKDD